MKKIIFYFLTGMIYVNSIYSQSDPIQKAEILIKNSTNHIYFVKVYPIGAIFSGFGISTANGNDSSYMRKYSLLKSDKDDESYWAVNPVDSTQ